MTDNTPTAAQIEQQRRMAKDRMQLLESTIHRLTIPSAMTEAERTAVLKELRVNSMSEAVGRLRTEYFRMENWLELMHPKQAAS